MQKPILLRDSFTATSGQIFTAGGKEYQLGGELGNGAIGMVRRATDRKTQQQFAVKFLAPEPKYIDLSTLEDIATRFKREGIRGTELTHEHLVKIHAYEENQNASNFSQNDGPPNPFIVMEYIQGTTLENFLRKRIHKGDGPRYNLTLQSMYIAYSIISALHYLHARRLIHRDVKPANIYLTRVTGDARPTLVKLGDFGVVKWGEFKASLTSGTLTVSGQQNLGTLKYMSPEQALRPKDIDVRSDKHIKKVETEFIGEELSTNGWNESFASYWISSLCRLLLRVQSYHHGGAVLITPDKLLQGLNIKYGIEYNRLSSALEGFSLAHLERDFHDDEIDEQYLEKEIEMMPVGLHLGSIVSRYGLEESGRELDAAIWFVSLLTRVDGLVLLTPNLKVQGFGVEITFDTEPSRVFRAINENATQSRLKEIDYNHFGTRHRSMMRYCSQIPGSIGFVISQDGGVRAMTQVNEKLVIWENIKLQRPTNIKIRRTAAQKQERLIKSLRAEWMQLRLTDSLDQPH